MDLAASANVDESMVIDDVDNSNNNAPPLPSSSITGITSQYSTLLYELEKKTPINRIISLPPPIFNIIFGEYLPLVNVGRFDSIMCNHHDRNKFLALLNGLTSEDYLESLDTYRNPRFFFFHRWLYQRHINYKHIKLGCNDPQEFLIRTIFPQKVEVIERLDIEQDLTHHMNKIIRCSNTKTVKVFVRDETPMNSPIYNNFVSPIYNAGSGSGTSPTIT